MNGKLVRRGFCGLAVAAFMTMGAAPAFADSVRVGVGSNGVSITVADWDKGHRKGHGGRDYYNDRHYDDKYGRDRAGWKGQGNSRRHKRFWHFNGWEPVGRGYRGDRCVPVQKKSRWRGKPGW